MSFEYQPRELEAAEQVYDVLQKYFLEGVTADSFPHHFLTIQKILGNIIRHSYLYVQVDFVASKRDVARSADIHEQIESIRDQLVRYFTNEPLKKNRFGVNFDDKKTTERLVTILKKKQVGFSLQSTVFQQIESVLSKIDQKEQGTIYTPQQKQTEDATLPTSNVQATEVKNPQPVVAESESLKLMNLPFENFASGLRTTIQMFPDNVAGYFAKMSEMGRIKIETENEVVLLDPAEVWKLYEIFRVQYPDLHEEVNPFAIWSFMSKNVMKPTYNHREKRNELDMSYREEFVLLIMMTLIENKVPVVDTASK